MYQLKNIFSLVSQSFNVFVLIFVISVSSVSCSDDLASVGTDLSICGVADVSSSGSGAITRAVGDISILTLHYTEKDNASVIKTRSLANIGSRDNISFTTNNSGVGAPTTGLFWQQLEEGSSSVPQPLYLTASRTSNSSVDAVSLEPLWATFSSRGDRVRSIPFGTMRCRMSKFTVRVNAFQASGEVLNIDPRKLSVYMSVYSQDVARSTIEQLAMKRANSTSVQTLIPFGSSSSLVSSIIGKSQLLTPQEITSTTKILSVWYDKDGDKNKDTADEIYTLDLSGVSVTRPSGSEYSSKGTVFGFNANEHITLTVNLTMGKSLSVLSVSISDWSKGTDWDIDGDL